MSEERSPSRRLHASGLQSLPRIGPYQLVELLGRGAMGEVWLARHEELDSLHALKLINDVQAGDEDGLRRFQREVEAMAAVDRHPSVVRIHSAGVAPDGRPYYAMEYVTGRSLKQALREGLPLEAGLNALEQVADGLAFVHARGIVHRDVKPENVLLDDRDGCARLTDFGLARIDAGENAERLTRTGEIIGTPVYMAPEQLDKARGPVSPHSDVWALGTILYELLTGTPPYMAATSLEVYQKLTEREPIPPPSTRSPHGSPQLDAVCRRALAHDPAARFSHAGELLASLRAARAAPQEVRRTVPAALLAAAAGSLALAGVALTVRALFDRQSPDRPQAAEAERPRLDPAPVASASPAPAAPSIRALQAELLEGEVGAAHGLRLLACAEAGGDGAGAARALALLEGDGPALAEARSRAARLRGDPALAEAAAASALDGAPEDPAARRAAALARALSLEAEQVDLELARLEAGAEAGEEPLAREWEAIARQLTAARRSEVPGAGADQEARLLAARAWGRVARLRARQRPEPPEVEAARAQAHEELAPLLAAVPAGRLRSLRRALSGAETPAGLESAELELAALGAGIGDRSREAVGVALGLGGPEAPGWAEVWLGLAGDLPALAVWELERAAGEPDPTRRLRALERARRLGPDLPAVVMAALEAEITQVELVRPALFLDAARLLVRAPELLRPLTRLLERRPLDPVGLERALEGLRADERDGLLARALARLHTADGRAGAVHAAEDARRAARLDPACAAAWLLRAEALLRQEAPPEGQVGAALECAAAAAPLAPEPHLFALAQTDPQRWTEALLVPLLLQGRVFRLPELLPALAHGDPSRLGAVMRVALATADGKPLDLGRSADRSGLLGLLALRTGAADLQALAPFPLAVRLEQEWLADESWEQVQERSLALVPTAPPDRRWAAEALALSQLEEEDRESRRALRLRTARAALRALADAWRREASWPPAAGASYHRWAGPALRATLPEYPQLARTWFEELRRPELTLRRLVEAVHDAGLGTKRPALAAEDLADPWGRSRGLVLAVSDHEAQRDLARWLIKEGAPQEAHLALLRAAAFDPDRGPWAALSARLTELAREHLWRADVGPGQEQAALSAIAGLVEAALARSPDQDTRRALLGARADSLLWRAGRVDDPAARDELLRRAKEDAGAAAGRQEEGRGFWALWRLVRAHGALGELEPFAARLEEARAVLRQEWEEIPDWQAEAVARDPLLPRLVGLPGYEALLAQARGEE